MGRCHSALHRTQGSAHGDVFLPRGLFQGELVVSSAKTGPASDIIKVFSLLLQAEQVSVCNGAPSFESNQSPSPEFR